MANAVERVADTPRKLAAALPAWAVNPHMRSLAAEEPSTVGARKLEYGRPLIPKQKKEARPVEITPNQKTFWSLLYHFLHKEG